MNLWHDISPERMQPEDFLAVIEIEKGSKNKYELDKQTGALRLDRILYTSTHYPANYGFIPRTYADDGDPLDVLVLCSEPIRPMSLVRVYPVGYFTMRDNGAMDDKILSLMGDLPRVELFARQTPPGWAVWGNEVTPTIPDFGTHCPEVQKGV